VEFSPEIYISQQEIIEGDVSEMQFIITRTGDISKPLKINYETLDGLAKAGVDYQDSLGSLEFQPEETTITINVPIYDDDEFTGAVKDFSLQVEIISDPLLNDRMYRFQTGFGTYLYVGEEERQTILASNFGFIDEGEAFNVSLEADDNLIPIYRFRNEDLKGAYLYVGEEERANLLTQNLNFVEEGLAFYTYGANASQANDISRFQTQPGGYIFVGETEKNIITQNYPNFTLEGIAFESL